jgi:hypothetical protein
MTTRDAEMLEALTGEDHWLQLTEKEQKAFTDMLDQLQTGKIVKLSVVQRDWVDRRYRELVEGERAEHVEEALNLHSLGVVPDGIPDPHARHYVGLARPLRPPHRMHELPVDKRHK